jgi:TP901-1 family phage major tail protein
MSGEKSGKDMLLKISEDLTVSVSGGQTFTLANHGLVHGDIVSFDASVGTAFSASRFYFVTDGTADGSAAAIDATTFKLALVPDGTAITCDTTNAAAAINGYKTIGGLRSSSLSFNADAIDVSNHGSNQWKNLKSGAGMRSVSVSGSGVYTNASNYRAMENSAIANSLVSLAFLDIDAGRIYSGSFKITSIEASGEYDGEAAFSMSADSSGTVSIAQLGT